MPILNLFIILLLLGLCLIYLFQNDTLLGLSGLSGLSGLLGQLGGEYIVSTNIIDDKVLAQDILAANVFMGADYTDANLSRSDINTIINGPIYLKDELANMYFTGNDVDGIGNFTVDGTNRVEGQRQPKRISINQLGAGEQKDMGNS
ncbi:MAG: hypothetical protein WD512_19725 [Candidatus Paceibacterota bacterium]